MKFKLENKTTYDTALLDQTITPLLRGFLNQYPFLEPSCKVHLTLFNNPQELWQERNLFYQGKAPDTIANLDGIFLPPMEKTDTLRILLRVWPEAAASARCMQRELAEGSRAKQGGMQRDEQVFNYFELIEQTYHEFSHLCSYDRLMRITNWEDPLLPTTNLDINYHDEFLAVYRSMTAMLHVLSPYLTSSLYRGLYLYYHDEFTNHANLTKNETNRSLLVYRNELDRVFGTEKRRGTPPSFLRKTIEDVIGHPLSCQEDFSLTDEEVFEYTIGLKRNKIEDKPCLYYLRNSEATYGGAHLSGMVRAFHAFAEEKIRVPFRNKAALPEAELHLENVMDIPFYTYMDSSIRLRLEEEMPLLFQALVF